MEAFLLWNDHLMMGLDTLRMRRLSRIRTWRRIERASGVLHQEDQQELMDLSKLPGRVELFISHLGILRAGNHNILNILRVFRLMVS